MRPTTRKILIIQGHPDPRGHHFGHALAAAYAKGAVECRHGVHSLGVATLDLPRMYALGRDAR